MRFIFPHHFNTIRTNTHTQQSSFTNIDTSNYISQKLKNGIQTFRDRTFRDETFRDTTFRDKTFRDKMGTLYTWIHVIILYSTWPYQVHENTSGHHQYSDVTSPTQLPFNNSISIV